jgi:uncharacterized protein Veg
VSSEKFIKNINYKIGSHVINKLDNLKKEKSCKNIHVIIKYKTFFVVSYSFDDYDFIEKTSALNYFDILLWLHTINHSYNLTSGLHYVCLCDNCSILEWFKKNNYKMKCNKLSVYNYINNDCYNVLKWFKNNFYKKTKRIKNYKKI